MSRVPHGLSKLIAQERALNESRLLMTYPQSAEDRLLYLVPAQAHISLPLNLMERVIYHVRSVQ